jgi:hypothetical protein
MHGVLEYRIYIVEIGICPKTDSLDLVLFWPSIMDFKERQISVRMGDSDEEHS